MTNNKPIQEKFDLNQIQHGIAEDERCSALDAYLRWIISQPHYSQKQMLDTVLIWNRRNIPPLHVEDIVQVLCDYLDLYRKGHRPKPVLTDDIILPSRTAESFQIPIDAWFTELGPGCREWKVIHRGALYESVRSPCGGWCCLSCSDRMRREWIAHLIQIAKEKDLYIIEVNEKDYFHTANDIREAGANYAWIRGFVKSTIITDRPIENVIHIPSHKLGEVLEATIPQAVIEPPYACPITTSTAWKLPQVKSDPSAKFVIKTWLPVFRQKEVALSLGAEPCSRAEWRLPVGGDAGGWERAFVKKIQACEKMIKEKLSRLDDACRSRAMQEMYILDENYEIIERHCQQSNSVE